MIHLSFLPFPFGHQHDFLQGFLWYEHHHAVRLPEEKPQHPLPEGYLLASKRPSRLLRHPDFHILHRFASLRHAVGIFFSPHLLASWKGKMGHFSEKIAKKIRAAEKSTTRQSILFTFQTFKTSKTIKLAPSMPP